MTAKQVALIKLAEGTQALDAGSTERAIECFDAVMALDPPQQVLRSAYLKRVDALWKLGRHHEAQADEKRWGEELAQAATQRRSADQKISEGAHRLETGNYEGALASLNQAISLGPGLGVQIRAREYRSQALWKLGRTEQAQASEQLLESLRAAAQISASRAQEITQRLPDADEKISEGARFLETGNYEGALASLNQEISLRPGLGVQTRAREYRSQALWKLARTEEAQASEQALEFLRAAAQISASRAQETTQRLRHADEKISEGARLLRADDFEGALACFDQARGLEPGGQTEIMAYEYRTHALWKLGRTEEAQASEQALESLRGAVARSKVGVPEEEHDDSEFGLIQAFLWGLFGYMSES